jgi:hypothetical protein
MTWYARLWLGGLLFSAVACASNPPLATIETTAVLSPTSIATATPARSLVPPSSIVAARVPTLPPATATWLPHTSTPPSIDSTRVAAPKVSSTFPAATCPPLPTPTMLNTQAAVQSFEHGLMFWLEARHEIWALLNSPLEQQFYWRILPNRWAEGMP